MEIIKKFKTTFALLLMILITVGFMYKQNTGLEVGNKAPDLKFNNPEGKEISLSSLKGKVVLVDFWHHGVYLVVKKTLLLLMLTINTKILPLKMAKVLRFMDIR